jgi:hypothetical protein
MARLIEKVSVHNIAGLVVFTVKNSIVVAQLTGVRKYCL